MTQTCALLDRRKKLAIIHVAKKQCHLDEDSYRAILEGAAGVTSSKDIETEDQYKSIIKEFKKLGFRTRPPVKKAWGCTIGQERYIKGLWKLVARNKDEKSLISFIKRITKIDHPRFLNKSTASDVIAALRKMCFKDGIDPDRKVEE